MPTPHDQLIKTLLCDALEKGAAVGREVEVPPGEVQRADVVARPLPGREPELRRAGLLGRMVDRPTLFEQYHRPPRPDLVR